MDDDLLSLASELDDNARNKKDTLESRNKSLVAHCERLQQELQILAQESTDKQTEMQTAHDALLDALGQARSRCDAAEQSLAVR